MGARLLLAIAVAGAVILSAPFVSQIRFWIRSTFPGHFVLVVGALVGLCTAAAIGAALFHIRNRRLPRYFGIATAVVLATTYAAAIATNDQQANAVERFHFVEYGLVTLLFYRAWRPLEDGAVFLMPLIAGLLVGTVDEWFQWFVPIRVGEMRDVFLNLAAIVSGLIFAASVEPPARVTFALSPASRFRVCTFGALAMLVFAAFVHVAHLGVTIVDKDAGLFSSYYDALSLVTMEEERARVWAARPPVVRRLSREDQYLSEGILHVQERNRRWTAGDVAAAWRENLILEKYYAPVLDTWYPAASGPAHRWPGEQRARAEHDARTSASMVYVSRADGAVIRTWPPLALWTPTILCAGALVAIGLNANRVERSKRRSGSGVAL